MRLPAIEVEVGPDRGNACGSGKPGSREHPQQRPLARHQRDRELPRLDRLGKVCHWHWRIPVCAEGDTAPGDLHQPCLEIGVQRRAQVRAPGDERLQAAEVRQGRWQFSRHPGVLCQAQLLQVRQPGEVGRYRTRQVVGVEKQCLEGYEIAESPAAMDP